MTDTIPQKILDTILQALRNSRGDDYVRAYAAFRTYSLARHERLVDQAIRWIEKISMEQLDG